MPAPSFDVRALNYPADLPIVQRRDEIADAIRAHQVVVVAGETGSGKTTQLPKICLEVGRGRAGQIGHTQPRRIAARSVAERIAEELHVDLGATVGYQVRFTDRSSEATRIKVMTDGILLNEMQHDRGLRRYDTLIIDEAHERSLNIDFILGYLKSLLPRRPDLKLLITSATIDPERFAEHFGDRGRPAPVIEVSGRTFPVEMRYRPLVDPDARNDGGGGEHDDVDLITGICGAVEELWTERGRGPGGQDILVFLSGEREIRDAADAVRGMDLPRTEVLPLYARLSSAEQHRVFSRTSSRRIILATNIAETSLTVPGIRYVIDGGTARISRYSQRTKVQRLPIEPISRASATQRAGRCGRLSDGVCIRLYSEDDFRSRPEFTEPEILRTSLASVILQMTALDLGDVARFPFIDPPDPRQVADGVRLLDELGALERAVTSDRPRKRGRKRAGRRLTAYGRTLARLPIDPRLGRMLLEADRLGCLAEVLVVVAALSVQDPRERPVEKRTQADQHHARFKDDRSDFASYLLLWRYLKQQRKALSGSAFRRMCKAEFLHYLRIREWQDVHSQLRRACRKLHLDPSRATAARDADPDWDTIHRAILAGLLSHVGWRDERTRDYLGARGARFGISPGSNLFRRQPDFVMATELVETTRLWARDNARIDPEWAEEVGAHLVRRSHSEPRWSRRQGAALATERVTLYGVPLISDRTVQYGRINPEESRELFIRHALVEGDWHTRHTFWADNESLLRRIGELESRARRHDIVVDDAVIFAFYDERIPAEVVSARHFDSWWKKERRIHPDLLTFTEELLTRDDASSVSAQDFPGVWTVGDLDLSVTYHFEPGAPDDGVTVHIPVTVLNQVDDVGFDWQVPGLRADLAAALLRSLPKTIRRHVVPVPDHAAMALRGADRTSGAPLTGELARVLRDETGVPIGPGDWDVSRVPGHLRITFSVEAADGAVLGSGKDLEVLREQLAGQVRAGMSRLGASIERTGMTTWALDRLPGTFTVRADGHDVIGHPALVDDGASVSLRVLATADTARAATRLGVRRLLLLTTTPPWKRVLARLGNETKLALGHNPHGSVPALLEDCLAAAVDALVAEHGGGEVRTEEEFDRVHAAVRTHVAARVLTVVAAIEPVLVRAASIRARLDGLTAPALRATVADARAQLDSLVRPGFVAATGADRLADLVRYLDALDERLTKASDDPARDARIRPAIERVEGMYADVLDSLPAARLLADDVVGLAWMIEELRVGLFAQRLGTAHPVSEKRVVRAIRAAQARRD